MRLGVWLFLPLSFGGCSGGYPLEPTLCDELCHVTKGPGCPESYEPAGCVVACEQTHLTDGACRPPLEAMLTCYRAGPDVLAKRCDFSTPWDQRPCEAEQQSFATCVSHLQVTPGPVD